MIIHTRHESEFLARNMLDDSAEHDLYVYVPVGMKIRTVGMRPRSCCTPSESRRQRS